MAYVTRRDWKRAACVIKKDRHEGSGYKNGAGFGRGDDA